MKKYRVELTKKSSKTIVITVPESISEEDVTYWAESYAEELFDIESYQGEVKWEDENLEDGRTHDVLLKERYGEDIEYETEGVFPI